MDGPKERQERAADQDASSPPKKPYVRPEFRRESAFETMALSCGKTRDTTEANCKLGVRTS